MADRLNRLRHPGNHLTALTFEMLGTKSVVGWWLIMGLHLHSFYQHNLSSLFAIGESAPLPSSAIYICFSYFTVVRILGFCGLCSS